MSTTTAPAPVAAPVRDRAAARRPGPATTRPRTPRPAVLVDAVVLGAAVLLALLPLVPVYGLRSLVPTAVGGVVLGAGTAALTARRRWDAGPTAGVHLLVYLAFSGVLAMPTAAIAGVLPSLDTVSGALRGVVSVWKEVLTLDPRLGGAADVLVAPYVLAFAGAAIAVTFATRARRRATGAWAALVPLVVLGVAVLLGTAATVQPGPAGVALVALLLPWVAARRGALAPRRVVALAVVAAGVVGAGLAAGPLLVDGTDRYVLRDVLVPPFDPRDQASPLSSFRAFIKDMRDTELLTVEGLPEGARIRLATMDAYDGVVWNVAGSEEAEGSGTFRRVGETIDTAVRGETAHVEIEIHELPMVWLPTVGYAERITFRGDDAVDLAADLRYNDATGTAVLADGIPAGTRVAIDAVVPAEPEPADIEDAALGQAHLPRIEGVPDAAVVFAADAAQSASTPALMATSLQDRLAQGYFSHGVEEGESPSLSGHGADRITTLLSAEPMVGDGEQYASAMAVMARHLGLPARVVLGFIPDPDRPKDEAVVVTGDDIQAWVEVQLAGHGWVAFDPTPDESRTPREEDEPTPREPDTVVRQPPPPLTEPVDPPEADTEQPQTQDTGEELVEVRDWTPVILIAAAASVPLLALLVPLLAIALAKRRRRRRRRAAANPVTRVVGGWQEVLDDARDLRRAAPPTATRRETAVHLAGLFPRPAAGRGSTGPAVGGTVAGLAASADAAVFGLGDPPDGQVDLYWQQVDVARRAMWVAVPRRHRLRARWSTASLRAERRKRRAGRSSR